MSSYVSQVQQSNGLEKKKAPTPNSYQFIIGVVAFSLITGFLIIYKKEKRNRFLGLFKNIPFMISLLGICIFSFIMLNEKGDDEETELRKRATKQGLLGFLIAIMAYLDLKAGPFWIIWLASYYLQI